MTHHPPPDPVAPLSVDWRTWVASEALEFFSPVRNPIYGEALGKPNVPDKEPGKPTPQSPLTASDFYEFLKLERPEYPWPHLMFRLVQFLADMVRVGLLIDRGAVPPGTDPTSHTYWPLGLPHSQRGGPLWLSALIGAPLIIPSYGSVTVAITGRTRLGDLDIGTGLVLDEFHILTNTHVVGGMAVDEVLKKPTMNAVGVKDPPEDPAVKIVEIFKHDEIDVAVIKVEPTSQLWDARPDFERKAMVLTPAEHTPGLRTLGGVAFRDPAWGDETYVFGYPPAHVRDADGSVNLTVQHGQVVNPDVTGYGGERLFLFSAIARPGNSGGPIVAQDGRVIGLVVEHARAAAGTDRSRSSFGLRTASALCGPMVVAERPAEGAPFYRGIPAGEIARALAKWGLEHLAPLDT